MGKGGEGGKGFLQEEGEDLTTSERISRMNAVIIQLGMVR